MLRNAEDERGCVECANMLNGFMPLIEQLPPEHRSYLLNIARHLIAAQERHDWLGMCDLLEFELAQWLSHWHSSQ